MWRSQTLVQALIMVSAKTLCPFSISMTSFNASVKQKCLCDNTSTWSRILVTRMHPNYVHTVFMFLVNECWVLFHWGWNSQGMKMTPYIHTVQRLRIGRAVSPCPHKPSWHTYIFTLWYMTICDSSFILDQSQFTTVHYIPT